MQSIIARGFAATPSFMQSAPFGVLKGESDQIPHEPGSLSPFSFPIPNVTPIRPECEKSSRSLATPELPGHDSAFNNRAGPKSGHLPNETATGGSAGSPRERPPANKQGLASDFLRGW